MRVFISWSGERSREVAKALRQWLPAIIQAVKPWMSASDIAAGQRWSMDVSSMLDISNFGILCVTPENFHRPWLAFEAGALSKNVAKGRVIPYLIDMDAPRLLRSPLGMFQGVPWSQDGTHRLVQSINSVMDEHELTTELLDGAFSKYWPDIHRAFVKVQAIKPADAVAPIPTTDYVLADILSMVARIERKVGAIMAPPDTANQGESSLKKEDLFEGTEVESTSLMPIDDHIPEVQDPFLEVQEEDLER
jgi:hypothetical protein